MSKSIIKITWSRLVETDVKISPDGDGPLEEFLMRALLAWDTWARNYNRVMSEMEDLIP